MKRFMAKKGFTLVEVLVAFVIFALMAAMVSTLLNTTNRARQNNVEVGRDIEEQQGNVYLVDPIRKFDDSKGKDGTASFRFVQEDSAGNKTPLADFTIDYQNKNSALDGEDALMSYDYLIGDTNYDSFIKSQKDAAKNSNGGSLISKLDSRIYATSGIDAMYLKMEDKGTKDGGYYYHFDAMFSATSMDESYMPMAQVKMTFPSEIISYGYLNGAGAESATPQDSIKLTVIEDSTLRISGKNTSGSALGTNPVSMFDAASYQGFWIVTASPIDSDLNKVFGTSASDQTSNKSGSAYVFTPFVDKTNTEEPPVTHKNVLGGFVNEDAAPAPSETEEPSDETTDEA